MHDPVTSHLAADAFTKSGQREGHVQRILLVLTEKNGQTAPEIAARLGLQHVQVARRMAEMQQRGLVLKEHGPDLKPRRKTCKVTGRECVVWWKANTQVEMEMSLE